MREDEGSVEAVRESEEGNEESCRGVYPAFDTVLTLSTNRREKMQEVNMKRPRSNILLWRRYMANRWLIGFYFLLRGMLQRERGRLLGTRAAERLTRLISMPGSSLARCSLVVSHKGTSFKPSDVQTFRRSNRSGPRVPCPLLAYTQHTIPHSPPEYALSPTHIQFSLRFNFFLIAISSSSQQMSHPAPFHIFQYTTFALHE